MFEVGAENYLTNLKHNYSKILSKLEILNPLLTIKRGYAVVKKENKVISKKESLSKGDLINIELQDGTIDAKVE